MSYAVSQNQYIRNNIINLIASNQMSQAIEKSMFFFKKEWPKAYYETVIISMEYCSLKDAIDRGGITLEIENMIRNRLAYRLLKILDKISN